MTTTFDSSFFDHAWDLFVVARLDGTIAEVNPAWERVLGWSAADLVGTTYREWLHPDDVADTVAALGVLAQDQAVTGFENRYRTRAGDYRWLQWNVVRDAATGLTRAIARDVTEHRRAARLVGHVEELTRIGSWEYEVGADDVRWSPMVHRIHDSDPDRGDPSIEQALARFPEEVSGQVRATLDALLAGGSGYDVELPVDTLGGRRIWIRATGASQCRPDGRVTAVYGTMEDVTAERARRLELARFKEFVELAHDGVWELDAAGRTAYANRRMLELLGRSGDDLEARPAVECVVEEDRPRLARALDNAGGAHPQELELRLSARDGATCWVHLAMRSRLDPDGGTAAYIVVATDISHVKESEERTRRSEAQLRTFFDLAPVPVLVTGWPDGLLLDGNLAAAELLGEPIERVRGRHHHELLEGLELPSTGSVRRRLEQDARYGPLERRVRRADGEERDVVLEGMILPTANGDPAVWTLVEDVTERRRTDAMKEEFVATVSHELRTPLTSITGAVELLARGITGAIDLTDDRARELVAVAQRNTDRLAELVDDLLDLQRLEAVDTPAELVELDLGELLEAAVVDLRRPAAGPRVTTTFRRVGPTPIRGDRRALTQMLANLVANAISFAPDGTEVAVEVRRAGAHAELMVRDHGPGVPDAFEPRLFEPFTQAGSSDRRGRGGTGLGLSIVAGVARRHGGSVRYEGPEDGGARFVVSLPLAGTGRT